MALAVMSEEDSHRQKLLMYEYEHELRHLSFGFALSDSTNTQVVGT